MIRIQSNVIHGLCWFLQLYTGGGCRDGSFMMLVVALSSRARIFGECSTIYSPSALFFGFVFEVEISSRTLILFSCQDLSTVAQ